MTEITRNAANVLGRTAVLNMQTGEWEIVDRDGTVIHTCPDLHDASEYLKDPDHEVQ